MFLIKHPFLVIFAVALLESMLLAKIGSTIGWGLTIALILLSTVVGSYMVRQQGFQTFQRLQLALSRGENPGTDMLEGVFIMVGGLLLVTPGFISDGVGFLLLIPFTRKALVALIVRQLANLPMASTVVKDQWTYQYRPGQGRGEVYEGERVDASVVRPTPDVERIEIIVTSASPGSVSGAATQEDSRRHGRTTTPDDVQSSGVIEGEFSRKDD